MCWCDGFNREGDDRPDQAVGGAVLPASGTSHQKGPDVVAIPEELIWLCHQFDAVYRPWDPRIDLLPNGVLTVMLDLSPQFRTG